LKEKTRTPANSAEQGPEEKYQVPGCQDGPPDKHTVRRGEHGGEHADRDGQHDDAENKEVKDRRSAACWPRGTRKVMARTGQMDVFTGKQENQHDGHEHGNEYDGVAERFP